MSDSTVNYLLASGTNAERLAFTPSPPSPANAPPNQGYLWYETDTDTIWSWDSVAVSWIQTGGAGLGGGVGVAAGTQTASTGTVVFSDANGVTFGLLGSTRVTATVKTAYAGLNSAITGGSLTVNSSGISINLPAYLTTAARSQDSSNYAGTNGAITGGSITVNTAGVSVNLPAYLTTAMASNRGTDFVQATAGFHGTNASGTIASSGISVSIGNYLTTAMASNRGSDFVQATAGFHGTNASGTIASDGISVSVGNYLTTAMASNRGSDFVQATAGFHGTNASGTIASDGISISVAAGGGGNVNFSAGTTSNTYSAVTFADSNGISWGLDNGTITATVKTDYQTSGAYLTTAALSGDTSKYVQAWEFAGNHTAGTTSSLQGTKIYFSGGNNVTLSGNSNTIIISGPNVAGAQTGISGIVASDATYSSGTVTFSGVGGGVTVNSNTGQRIDISVGNYITTAALSGDTSKYAQAWELTGNTAGTTSSLQGTKFYFEGGNSITVSGNSNTIKFSVGNYLTTAALSGDSSKYAGINGAITGGSITVNTSGVSINLPAYLTTAMQSNAATISNINVSGGSTSSNLSAFKFIDSNGVSWSLDTGSKVYATVKTDYQTSGAYLTTAALSGDTSKYVQAWEFAGANTAGTTSSLQGTKLYFSGGANVTLSGNSNTIIVSAAAGGGGSVSFSAGTSSAALNSLVFSNSGAISFGLNGSTITASASTVGTATTVAAVASANSVGTITRWAAEDHAHAGIGAIGISTGNTTGTSGSVQGTYWIVGGTNQTISQITSNNGSHTLVIAGKNEGYAAFLEPYPLQTATQTFAPGAGTWYLAPFSAFGSMSGGRINVLVQNTGTANLFLDIGETAYNSGSTGGIQQSYTYQMGVALFSQGSGTNSTRLESLWSNSNTIGWSKSLSISTNAATNIAVSLAMSVSYLSDVDLSGGSTYVQYANSGSSTIGNSSGNSTLVSTVFSSGRNLMSGSLVLPIPFNTTISAGNYWLGYAWSSTRARASTGNLTTGSDYSFGAIVGMSRLAVDSLYRNFGSTASTARSQFIPYGLYTAAAATAPPTNINLSSDLSSLASQFVPYFNFQVRGLTK